VGQLSGSLPEACRATSCPIPTAVITCAVLEAEIRHFARPMPHILHIEVLEQGLHNEPPKLRQRLQETIDRVETQTRAEAIVLGYGLCSRGIEGIATRRCRLAIARAHDCITHLLGDKDRYARYVAEHPGTYWYSVGWNRHHLPPGEQRYRTLYEQYLQKFGPDNAQYLMEAEQQWFNSYSRAAYVDLGVETTPQDVEYTQRCAAWLKWTYDYQRGDPALLIDLLAGNWDEARFVVLEPGQTVRMTADQRVIEPTIRGHRREERPNGRIEDPA
jgi:hypothetical protein